MPPLLACRVLRSPAMHPSNTTVARPPARRKPRAARAIPAAPTPGRRVDVVSTPALAEKTASLRRFARASLDGLFGALETSLAGLTAAEARERIAVHGPNEIAHEGPPAWYRQLATAFRNPFILVLIVLAVIQLWSSPDDLKGPILIAVMVTLSVVIRFVQEYRSNHAAEQLRALVRTTATVYRPSEGRAVRVEVPLGDLVPGDVVALAAGDMVPADLRLLTSKDLFISQAVLTGEAMPVEKAAERPDAAADDGATAASDLFNVCLMGTNVVSGTATALVLATGAQTYFGSIARSILGERPLTSFDIGVSRVTWLMIRFMLVMAPVVLVVNGITKGDWKEASLFALAVAVGLIPEMLPLVVTANLARGAIAMSRRKVVVKRLNAIQNFGAMDVLCTDKTGTLTQDRVVLEQHVDVVGQESREVLRLAYVNSYHQTGLRNLLDRAVLEHDDCTHGALRIDAERLRATRKVDEVPFDFMRKRMSVVIEGNDKRHVLICKGAVDEILAACDRVQIAGETGPITDIIRRHVARITGEMNEDGMRVVAVAYRHVEDRDQRTYSVADERGLVLAGYIGFLDPPRDTAAAALEALAAHGVAVKILTGDNEVVAKKVCRDVGLSVASTLLGAEIDELDDDELSVAVERATVCAKLNPLHKARLVRVLKKNHTVGFLGDGINDAPALREADIGISVDTAVDVAKESADIILLEKSLLVLEEGIIVGRTTFGNIVKYVKMAASSNFGNVFSVLIASAFLPFLPMLAIHLLFQNLLYDISQLSIPWDRMDAEFLRTPRKWDTKGLRTFMLAIGPLSSIFDLATYALMWFVFRASSPEQQSLFQSGWFIEGLLSQTLVVHMIRTPKIPFVQSRAATPVIVLTLLVMAAGIAIPFSALGAAIGLRPLPWSFFPWLALILLGYCTLTQAVKRWYIRRVGVWL